MRGSDGSATRIGTFVVAVGVAVGIGCSAPQVAAARTAVATFSPFAGDGTLRGGLRATPEYGGSCASGSFMVSGADVFRCFAGNAIRDPCYVDDLAGNDDRSVVVCVATPWDRSVVRLRISGDLDSAFGARANAPPWALRLSSGTRCVFLEGATTVVRGQRLNYGCGNGRWLIGTPDRGRPTWRIRQVRGPTDSEPRRVSVAAAYF